jgi:hypothetical protein
VQDEVRRRANFLCEYCHASEQWQYVRFTVDHVVPIAQQGSDTLENLALACFHCNRQKTDKATVVDRDSGEEVPLFNPRQHVWSDHFIWSADSTLIVGLTPIGRAAIEALGLNRDRVRNIRAADRVVGRHPPPNDPIQQPAEPR